MKHSWFVVVVVSLCAGSVARAQAVEEPAGAPAPAAPTALAPEAGPRITVMWAPIRLIIPVGELTFEYRVMDKLGVSLEFGGGTRTLETGNMDVKGTELEGGAQVRYYVLGDFRKGVQVGAEVLDEYVKFDELPAGVVGAAAGGITAGPFVGYKIATHVGFTFEAQLGARYLVVDPPVSGMGSTSDFIKSRWLPLLHLNVGWSF